MRDFTENYSYQDRVEWVTERLKEKPGFTDSYQGTTSQTLIQLLNDVVDGLHYKLERRSQENYSATARLATSVRAAVSGVGYRPRRRVSATGTLLLELVDDDGDPVTAQGNINIPYGEPIFFDGEEFISNGDYVIRPGESSIEISVKQGTLESETFNFEEEPFSEQGFIEFEDYVGKDEFSLSVVADEDTYNDVFDSDSGLRIRALSFADGDDPVYDIKFHRNGMRILFGDNIFGKRPDGNVTVSWVESDGDEVDVVDTDLEFEFESDILLDDIVVNPRNEYRYQLTNITPIRGGREEETIEEMRDNLRAFIRTNDRAVNNFDFEFWVRRSGIGDIQDVRAYGEHETNRLIFTMNNIYLTYATGDRQPLNPEQIRLLRNYLRGLKIDTTHLVFRPVQRVFLAIRTDFRRHPDLPISETQLYNVLRDRINEYFEVEDGTIGKGFQHSEFVEYLQNLTIRFNNVTYPMTDFVRVRVEAMVPIEIPQDIYDGVIVLDTDYSVTPNDVWTIVVNGEAFTVVATSQDSVTTLVDKMQTAIFNGTSLMTARPEPNKIRLTHPSDEGTFTVSVGSGDLVQFTRFEQYIQLPRPNNDFNTQVDQIVPGSVKIVDGNNNTIMEDDGDGNLVDESGGYPSVRFFYEDCRMEYPSIPSDEYFVVFQQNQYQNFDVTREALIDVMPIRTDQDPEDEYFFSEIEILT